MPNEPTPDSASATRMEFCLVAYMKNNSPKWCLSPMVQHEASVMVDLLQQAGIAAKALVVEIEGDPFSELGVKLVYREGI